MPHTAEVFKWLESNINDTVLEGRKVKSYLYVGWCSVTKDWWMTTFVDIVGIEEIGLLEIFKGNFDKFCNINDGRVEAKHGDISMLDSLYPKDRWDLVYWDHGPEHAESLESLKQITEMLKDNTNIILYACPWGLCPQKALYGNAHEEHATTIYEKDFEDMGMTVRTFGRQDNGAAGELVAWWIRE